MAHSGEHGEQLSCNIYIDGDNIQISMEHVGGPEQFDPRKLADLLSREEIGGKRLQAKDIFYYDATNERAPEDIQKRQQAYIERLKGLPNTHVVMGVVRGHQQKGVDVQLAVDALEAALTGKVGAVAIASGDGDFRPVIEALKRNDCPVIVLAFKNALSHELREAADKVVYLPEHPEGWKLAA